MSEQLKIGRWTLVTCFALSMVWVSISPVPATARQIEAQSNDEVDSQTDKPSDESGTEVSEPPEVVAVETVVDDRKIEDRLNQILRATEWFVDSEVEVTDGVAFLSGSTRAPEHREWAGNLARKTQDVVAVVNRISVDEKPFWDFSDGINELKKLGREVTRALPQALFAILILGLTVVLTKLAIWMLTPWVNHRLQNGLLRNVAKKALTIPFLLFGIYLALRVSGLSRLALTVLGGTGVVGLVIGIAFRDIAENFLASLLISTQRPFREDDLIEVNGQKGFVQKVTTRGTTIMTQDGNHIQIPNSMIYKSVVTNFTANPRSRIEFTIGIEYDSAVAKTQQLLYDVILGHPAVIADPEPMVLVDSLGAAAVNLRVLAWIDSKNHSQLKVRSSLIRIAKNELLKEGIVMPDEAREIILKRPLEVRMIDSTASRPADTNPAASQNSGGPEVPRKPTDTPEPVALAAEGGFDNDDRELVENAKLARSPDESENLLEKE